MPKKTIKVWMLIALILFFTGGSVLMMAFVRRALNDLPSVTKLESYVPPLVTKVIDAYGLPVGEFFTERRTTVPLTRIPFDLRRAVMATEDSGFYDHWGIDIKESAAPLWPI